MPPVSAKLAAHEHLTKSRCCHSNTGTWFHLPKCNLIFLAGVLQLAGIQVPNHPCYHSSRFGLPCTGPITPRGFGLCPHLQQPLPEEGECLVCAAVREMWLIPLPACRGWKPAPDRKLADFFPVSANASSDSVYGSIPNQPGRWFWGWVQGIFSKALCQLFAILGSHCAAVIPNRMMKPLSREQIPAETVSPGLVSICMSFTAHLNVCW